MVTFQNGRRRPFCAQSVKPVICYVFFLKKLLHYLIKTGIYKISSRPKSATDTDFGRLDNVFFLCSNICFFRAFKHCIQNICFMPSEHGFSHYASRFANNDRQKKSGIADSQRNSDAIPLLQPVSDKQESCKHNL